MKRDVNKLMELYKGEHGYPFPELLSGKVLHNTAETIYGRDGEYFAYDDGDNGQYGDDSIIDYNCPPGQMNDGDFSVRWNENQSRINNGTCQPGLWCQWTITSYFEDGEDYLEWDGHYIEWLEYLIEHFFNKWGVKLNGEIEWVGEDTFDLGKIVVTDNVVKVLFGRITYEEIKKL
jgi:hypothetical protein